jgi:hypothetical protein
LTEPLNIGDCICMRHDCAYIMLLRFSNRLLSQDGFRRAPAVGLHPHRQHQRFPTHRAQVETLLASVNVEGIILDPCGARIDSITAVLTRRGHQVIANDIDNR